jgi:hypothetical protein
LCFPFFACQIVIYVYRYILSPFLSFNLLLFSIMFFFFIFIYFKCFPYVHFHPYLPLSIHISSYSPYSGYYNIILPLVLFSLVFVPSFPLIISILFIQSTSSACHFSSLPHISRPLILTFTPPSRFSLPLIPFSVHTLFSSNHGFHFLIHFLAFISFFASTWGSSRSEWVRALENTRIQHF